MKYLIVMLLATNGLTKIIQDKIDSTYIDNLFSQIVESSMDDLRYKLRQAIYSISIKKNSESFVQYDSTSTSGKLGEYEEWLLDQFINQILRRTNAVGQNEATLSTTIDPVTLGKTFKPSQRDSPMIPSHTMTIALETFTYKPLATEARLLVTSDDTPQHIENQIGQTLSHSSSHNIQSSYKFKIAQLPPWLLLLASISLIVLSLLPLVSAIVICRRKRFKAEVPQQIPNRVHISSFSCIPDRTNTPGDFLERMRCQRTNSLLSTDRDTENIWATAGTHLRTT